MYFRLSVFQYKETRLDHIILVAPHNKTMQFVFHGHLPLTPNKRAMKHGRRTGELVAWSLKAPPPADLVNLVRLIGTCQADPLH